MTLEELMAKACLLPLRFEPGDAENAAAITNEDGVVIFVEGDAPDDEREATAALMVHCVNNFAQVVEALRDALGQLDDYNAESASNSRWAEWHSTLAAAHEVVKAKPVKWNHMLDVAFTIPNSPHENWWDIPFAEMISALENRVSYLKNNQSEATEAFGFSDTYQEKEGK